MRIKLIIVVATAFLVCFYFLHQHNKIIKQTSTGVLQLPLIKEPVTENSLMAALVAIEVVPVTSLNLKSEDRISFLQFLQQICALAQMPKRDGLYLSKNATVWRVLRENWPVSKNWFEDPSLVPNGEDVSIKAIAPRIFALLP